MKLHNDMRIVKIFCRKARTLYRITYNALFNRPIGNIYMFHMVCPRTDYVRAIDTMRVSPEFMENYLKERQKEVEFISIDEMPKRMREKKKKGQKTFGVVTFDDGYDDNFVYAYPILKKLQIPFIIYVAVNLVNDHTPIWNYPLIIERIIRKNEKLELGNGETYICGTEEEKDQTYRCLRLILFGLPYKQLQEEFKRLFDAYLTEDVFPINTLTWAQIEELSSNPLCTIGAHTMSHCRLTIKDEESLSCELLQSKKIIEEHIGKPVCHMSYPYGAQADVSEEAKRFAAKVGYETALMSGGGHIRKNDVDMYSIKRIPVHE